MGFSDSPGGPPGDDFDDDLTGWARELAEQVVRSSAEGRDREGRWDPALFTRLSRGRADRGLTGPLVPRDLGGDGLSAAQTSALLAGVGEGARDPGLALALAVHAVLATVPIRAFGTPRQQEHYLPRMAAGEWVGAVSLRQTQGGSLAPTVEARPAPGGPDGWVLTGTVDLVACAPVAHHLLVVAAHEDGGRTAFLVDRAAPGVRIDATGPEAVRTCPVGRLTLDACPVPEECVLGTLRGAPAEVEPLLAALDWVFLGAPWLGVMRALTKDAVRTAGHRRLFGRPLSHDQSARFTLADLAARCELAAGLLERAAAQFDTGLPAHQDAAAARLFTAAAARTVVEGAARLAGPAPRDDDGLIERAHRDALFLAQTGGGSEVLRPVIAASLLGLG